MGLRGFKKFELDEKDAKIIGSIPSAKKAAAIWAKFAERTRQAKEDRTALGKELIQVRDQLATKGCKGLFTRWLKAQHMPHDRAYSYIALAGGGKPKTKMKCYIRKLGFLRFQTLFSKAKTNDEKVTILNELIQWVKDEYKIIGGKK